MVSMFLNVAVCGPMGDFGPWHSRQTTLAGLMRSAGFSVPCTSWQLEHMIPCVHNTLHKIVALHPVFMFRPGNARTLSARVCGVPASSTVQGQNRHESRQ